MKPALRTSELVPGKKYNCVPMPGAALKVLSQTPDTTDGNTHALHYSIYGKRQRVWRYVKDGRDDVAIWEEVES